MADKPVENLVYDFLTENADTFGTGVELHPSAYEKRQGDAGIIIGDADTSMLPNGNEDEMTEFDGLLTLEIYGRVVGEDKTERAKARQIVFDIKKKLLQLFETYPTLNSRGCRVNVMRQVRFFDDTRADKWAIERVPVVINPKDLKGE